MDRRDLRPLLAALGIALTAVAALALRSDLSYRTAFVDEASMLCSGWRMLHGREAYAARYFMGWPPLSAIPLGLAGWLGGVEAARGLNAALGALTVVFVLLIARRAYGAAAGYLAGALYAAYGPAIFVSTFATYDSLSMFLAGAGLCFWVLALLDGRSKLYTLGSLAIALAVLAKYAALVVAVAGATSVAAAAAWQAWSPGGERQATAPVQQAAGRLVRLGLPFLILPAYALLSRQALMLVWQHQVLTKQSAAPGAGWAIVAEAVRDAGAPFAIGLVAFLDRRARSASLVLLAAALSLLPYHLLNRDASTLFKHTSYMMLGLAPLAAGGVAAAARALAPRRPGLVGGALGLVLVALVAVQGQRMLPGLRGYWSDSGEAMGYLQGAVAEGETLLVEQGQVAEYYLVEKGQPGHVPARVVDTWWYQDELGGGPAAFERAIAAQRFGWIVFDYTVTADLDRALRPRMAGRYALRASFPARIHGRYGRIEVFQAMR